MGSCWMLWFGALAVSVAAVLLGVWSGRPDVLALVMSVVSVAIASIAIAENRAMTSAGALETSIASSDARHMGLVWSLGALCLLFTYAFFLEWKEWLVFTGVFSAVALLCLGFSIMIDTGEGSEAREGDAAFLKLARYLTIGQLVGMIATMIGLVVDGKIPASAVANPGWYDWAGNVIFFYGALTLVAISANVLWNKRGAS